MGLSTPLFYDPELSGTHIQQINPATPGNRSRFAAGSLSPGLMAGTKPEPGNIRLNPRF